MVNFFKKRIYFLVTLKIENGFYNLIHSTKEVIKETHLPKKISYLINLQGIIFFMT
jgi:hypothetical protein